VLLLLLLLLVMLLLPLVQLLLLVLLLPGGTTQPRYNLHHQQHTCNSIACVSHTSPRAKPCTALHQTVHNMSGYRQQPSQA
jgi:hypothetical protein